MTRIKKLKHEFVETIPSVMENGTLYVSLVYSTAIHKCCCGCGSEIVTPLSPTDWKLIFDGESVSLYPSIGNWSFPCESHYWIEGGNVEWAPKWSRKEIQNGRSQDRAAKLRYFTDRKRVNEMANEAHETARSGGEIRERVLWKSLKSLLRLKD